MVAAINYPAHPHICLGGEDGAVATEVGHEMYALLTRATKRRRTTRAEDTETDEEDD